MNFYEVPMIGDGKTPESAFRPDLPKDAIWSCVDENGKTMIVVTVENQDQPAPSMDRLAEAVEKGSLDQAAATEIAVASLDAAIKTREGLSPAQPIVALPSLPK